MSLVVQGLVVCYSALGLSEEERRLRFNIIFKVKFAVFFCFVLCLALAPPSFAADKNKEKAAANADKPSYELPQPAKENLDFTMYQRIREEGPDPFACDGLRLRSDGWHWPAPYRFSQSAPRQRVDARSIDGDGLQQRASGRLGRVRHGLAAAQYLGADDVARYGGFHRAGRALVALHATAQSTAQAVWVTIKDEKDFDKYKGKLAGKIVLLGDMREVKPVDKPLFTRMDEKDLAKIAEYPRREARGRPIGGRII